MSPEENHTHLPETPNDDRLKLAIRLVAILAVVLVVTLGIFALFNNHKPKANENSQKFSVLTTVPSENSVTMLTRSMSINFSQPITSSGVSVTSSPSVVTATRVNNKTLSLTFAQKTLSSGQTYTITVKSVTATNGQRVTNWHITFTPSVAAPVISGETALGEAGLSSDQISKLNTYISQFDPWAQAVDINQSGISYYSENPSDENSIWAMNFGMEIDGVSYTALAEFYDTVDLRLKLSDTTTGQQVFTAGDPGAPVPTGIQ